MNIAKLPELLRGDWTTVTRSRSRRYSSRREGFSVWIIAASAIALIVACSAAHSETDVFMRAVGFALTGSDDVVFEETTEPIKDDELTRLMRQSNPDFGKSHHNNYKEHDLMLLTDDQDPVTRAWQYIYGHGCVGKKSPF